MKNFHKNSSAFGYSNPMRKAFLFILLLSFSYASLVWEYSTGGEISLKPVAYQNMIVSASDDGKLYAIDPNSGLKKWQTTLEKKPTDMLIFENSVFVSTTTGKIKKIGNNGVVSLTIDLTSQNATYVYGMSANSDEIFVTASNGIYVIDKSFSIKKISSFNESIVGLPAAGSDYVIYGKENELVKMNENGVILWKVKLDGGTFWTSRPVIESGVVYVGALDNKMHAYVANNGLVVWEVVLRNWIMSTPHISNGIIYFGGNDGNVYAVDAGNGEMKWSAQTQLAVQTMPETGFMGGREVIFVGSTDKSIYAIAKDNGEIVWKTVIGGAVGDPLFYQNKIMFGAQDGSVHAYSTERACSITNPLEAELIGQKELVVGGKYVAEGSNAYVLMSINGGEWDYTNTTQDGWNQYVDPTKNLIFGLNTISCLVVDDYGQESGTTYTTIAINYDSTIPLNSFVITTTSDVVEGTPFTVFVNDLENGEPVDRINISVNGQSYFVDKTLNITINEPGEYTIAVNKIGFIEATKKITVNSTGVSPFVLVGAIIVIVILLWQIWVKIRKRKPRR
ncbi:MAG: PQQ-binding-like beta-propeller repeat protein [Candidatus Micrarchaeota archaeon]